MKDSYFLYALIVLVVILGFMIAGAVIYIGTIQVENQALKAENEKLNEVLSEFTEEISILSDRIEKMSRGIKESTGWNKETF